MYFRQTPLSAMLQAELCPRYPLERFQKNEIIFLKDDTDDSVYFVKSGRAKAISFDANGNSVFFLNFKPGDIFGYYSTLTKKSRTATLVSDSDLEVYKIRAQDFTEFVTSDSGRALMMMEYLAASLRHNSLRLSRNATMEAQERVAALLVFLMEEHKTQELQIENREDFASQLNLSRETLSRILNKFAKEGLVELSAKNLRITNPPALYGLISQE